MYTNKPKFIHRMLDPETRERLTVDDVEVIAAFFDDIANDEAGYEFKERAFSLWTVGKNYTDLLTSYGENHDWYALFDEAEKLTKEYIGEYDEEEYENREEYEEFYNEKLEENCKMIAEKEGYVLSPYEGRLLFLSKNAYIF